MIELEELINLIKKGITTDDMEVVGNGINDLRTEILFDAYIEEDAFDLVARECFCSALCHMELAAREFRKAAYMQARAIAQERVIVRPAPTNDPEPRVEVGPRTFRLGKEFMEWAKGYEVQPCPDWSWYEPRSYGYDREGLVANLCNDEREITVFLDGTNNEWRRRLKQ